MERYRQRHARKLARKAARRGHQGPPTVDLGRFNTDAGGLERVVRHN
jgi:hypothetical protein